MTKAHSTLRRLIAALLIVALAAISAPIGVAQADAQPPLPGYGCDAPLPAGAEPLAFDFKSANDLLSMAEPTARQLSDVSATGTYTAGTEDHIMARWKKYNEEIQSGARKVASPLTWPEYRRKYVQVFNNRAIGARFEEVVGQRLGLTGEGWKHNVKLDADDWPPGTTPVNRRIDFSNLLPGVKMLYELKSGAGIDKAQLVDLVKAAQATGSRLVYVFGKPPTKTALKALQQVAQDTGNGVQVSTRCFKAIPTPDGANPRAPMSTDGMNPSEGPLDDTIDDSPDSPEKAAEENYVGRALGTELDAAAEAKAQADEKAGQGAPAAPVPAQVKPSLPQQAPRQAPRPQAPVDQAPANQFPANQAPANPAPAPQSAPQPESAPDSEPAPQQAPVQVPVVIPVPVGSAPVVVTVDTGAPPPITVIPQSAPVSVPVQDPVELPQLPASTPQAPSAPQSAPVPDAPSAPMAPSAPDAPSAPSAPGSSVPLGEPTPATAPGTGPGGIDFTNLQLRYVADTNDAGPGVRYSFAANGTPNGGASYGGRRAAQMASDAFFVWMALDPNLFWVNLRPDEPDRIIDGTFGRTQAGQVLLEADLTMKNESATLQKQDTDLGRKFVDALQGRKCYLGRRLWIEPLPATVHEDKGQLYIVDTPLTVKIGHDNGYDITPGTDPCTDQDPAITASNGKLFEDMIMPALIDHVNHAPEFADLRRVYSSRVAAEWFRKRNDAKPTVYANVVGSGNIDKWTTPWDPHDVFNRYLTSLQGVASFSWTEKKGDTTFTYTNRWGGVDFSKVDLKEMGDAEFNEQQPQTAAAASQAVFTTQVIPQAGPGGGQQIWLGGMSSQQRMSGVWKGDPAVFVQPPQAIRLLAAATSNPVFYVAIALPVLGWLAVGVVMWRRRQRPTTGEWS